MHASDDGGGAHAEQHKWWLEAPPAGRWHFRTEMKPSSFVEKEYQLYRCVSCVCLYIFQDLHVVRLQLFTV